MMGEYRKTIPKEKLLTPEDANKELASFLDELFHALGYDMEILFCDDKINGKREIKATWIQRLKEGET